MSNENLPMREIKIADDWTVPHENGVGRRTIVRGAAWSVPVVAAAVAAPLAAASNEPPFVCPVTPATDEWTGPVVTQGAFTNGIHQWDAGFWTNTADATPGNNGELGYYLEFPYEQVAGHTYTFSTQLRASGTGPGSAVIQMVSGGHIGYWSGAPDAIPVDNQFHPVSWSYTATETGTTTFRYSFGFGAIFPGQQNWDLTVTIPLITCS